MIIKLFSGSVLVGGVVVILWDNVCQTHKEVRRIFYDAPFFYVTLFKDVQIKTL